MFYNNSAVNRKLVLSFVAVVFLLFIQIESPFAQCASNALTTTYASNNGQDGNIFDVVALNDIEIFCFDGHFEAGTVNYEIYYKFGTSIGFQSTPGVWFLAGSGSVASAGPGNPTPLNLSAPIQVCQGTTVGFYITNIGVGNPNARYTNGTAVGAVYTSDANIQVLEGYGKVYSFANTFQPRVWNGTVRYNTIVLCTPLPIELNSFDVSKSNENDVLVQWSTASEINNDYFTIEKSKNGEVWEDVQIVKGAGNSNEVIHYQIEDKNPFSGTSYYRLRQTDFDGNEEVSDVKSINFKEYSTLDLEVFPIPAKESITIVYPRVSQKEVRIHDALGSDVTSSFEILESNKSEVKYSIRTISSGVYFLTVEGNTKKIVISR